MVVYAATLIRIIPAFTALFLAARQEFLWSSILLVLSVVCDGLFVRIKKKAPRFDADVQLHIEGLTDFFAFGVCPALFCVLLIPRIGVAIAAFLFLSSGIFRIARFNCEGLLNGYYRGLPITYNGYIIPAVFWGVKAFRLEIHQGMVFCFVLVIVSLLMISSRLRIKEVG